MGKEWWEELPKQVERPVPDIVRQSIHIDKQGNASCPNTKSDCIFSGSAGSGARVCRLAERLTGGRIATCNNLR